MKVWFQNRRMKFKREQQCKNNKDPGAENDELGSEKSLDDDQNPDDSSHTKNPEENAMKNIGNAENSAQNKAQIDGAMIKQEAHMSPGHVPSVQHMGVPSQAHLAQTGPQSASGEMQQIHHENAQHVIKKENGIENIDQNINQDSTISQWMSQSAATIPAQVYTQNTLSINLFILTKIFQDIKMPIRYNL